MKHELFIAGVIPSKKNSKQILTSKRTGKPFISSSKSHKEWAKSHVWGVRGTLGTLMLKSCFIELVFWSKDNHKFDLTNKAESIMDLLVDAKVIEDDNYSVVPRLSLRFGGVCKERAGCLIVIDDLKEECIGGEQLEVEF